MEGGAHPLQTQICETPFARKCGVEEMDVDVVVRGSLAPFARKRGMEEMWTEAPYRFAAVEIVRDVDG